MEGRKKALVELEKQYDEFVRNNPKLKEDLDKLLSLKGQASIVPMDAFVATEEIIQKVKTDICELSFTHDKVLVRYKSGYSLIFPIREVSAFKFFLCLIDTYSNKDKYDKEVVQGMEKVMVAALYILQMPTWAFLSDKLFAEAYSKVLELELLMQSESEKIMDSAEKDAGLDAEFDLKIEDLYGNKDLFKPTWEDSLNTLKAL